MSVHFKMLLVAFFLVSCGTSANKDAGRNGGKQGAKDCRNKKERDVKKPSDTAATDPWGEPLQLVQRDVSFTDLQATLSRACVSCHAGYDTAAIARQNIDLIIARTDMEPKLPGFMPKDGTKLTLEQRSRFIAWKFAGFPGSAGENGDVLGDETINDEWFNDDC